MEGVARILDGRALAEKLNAELQQEVASWTKLTTRAPRLVCMLVGADPASQLYVNKKVEAAEKVGISASLLKYPATTSQEQLLQDIERHNHNENVDGILVQLPLPDHIAETAVCSAVSADKDVDGFNRLNIGRMCCDEDAFVPATPLGVREILVRNNIETLGKDIVVVGRSKNVGMPMAMLLHSDGRHESGLGCDATVTICHRFTPRERLAHHCRHADIIVSATGVPGLISADMIKPGATVIDVGITRVTGPDGKKRLRGDVDFEEVSKVAGAITPVPGGVGPMTVAMVLQNTFRAARSRYERSQQTS